jgi:DNA-binding SARP family transcriptional activator
MILDDADLGRVIRERRLAAGWDQESLARLAGVSVRTLRNIELGRVRSPRRESVQRLFAALPDVHADRAPNGAGAGAAALRIAVLGPLLLHRGPYAVDLRSRRLRDLLGLLAIRAPHAVGRDEIVDTLWNAEPPRSSHMLVNTYVARLRTALASDRLGNPLVRTVGGYRLTVEPDRVDVAVFDDLLDRGLKATADGDPGRAAGLLTRALDCWRGPLLVDAGPGLARHPTAAAIAARHVSAACAYADAGLAVGDFDAVATRLRLFVEQEPLHEGLHARLMLALAGAGEQASALELFARLRSRLADNLGISPGPVVHDAHLSVLRQTVGAVPAQAASLLPADPACPAAVPAQLPGGTAGFVGRDAQLQRLHRLRADADNTCEPVVAVLTGQAGVGKTALAATWARRVRERFPDGQLYVNLRGFDPAGPPADPADVVYDFLTALGARTDEIPTTPTARAALFRTLTTDRRLLVVLDNALSTDQVRPLLPGGAGSLVVVTSRDKLVGLVADGAHPIVVDLLNRDDAVALLANRVGRHRLARERTAAYEIIERCARLPLALTIAAARATTNPGFSLTSVAAELRDDHRGLDTLDGGDGATSVRSALSWSCHRLDPGPARMFRLLGLVPGLDITAPAAASLAGVPRPRAAAALSALAAVNLVDEHPAGRYSLHDLLRRYARELVTAVDSGPDRNAALERITHHYIAAAQRAAQLVAPQHISAAAKSRTPPPSGAWFDGLQSTEQALRWYDTERATLLATIRQAATDGRDAAVCDLADALTELFDRRGHWHDWVAVTDMAQPSAARLADPVREARLNRSRARA